MNTPQTAKERLLALARLDQDQGVAFRIVEKAGDDLRRSFARTMQADDATAAQHGDGGCFIGEAGGVLTQIAVREIGDAEGIGEIGNDAFRQHIHPLTD